MNGVLERLSSLYSAVLCDALDEMGLWDQAMASRIAPLAPTHRLVGRVRTILARPTDTLGSYLPDTYERWARAYDGLGPGDVLVIAAPRVERGAVWGELRTERLSRRGAAGLVTDGYIRDCARILLTGFPVFCAGRSPEDCRGRIEFVDRDVEVACGGVRVSSGDYVVGDLDGVVVIPKAAAEDAVSRACEKDRIHAWIHDELKAGRKAQEVVQTYLRPRLPSKET